MSENLDEYEELLHKRIRGIQEEYQRALKPYIDELVHINNLRPPKLILTAEQLESFCINQFSEIKLEKPKL